MKPLRPSVLILFVKSPWLTASAASPTFSISSFNSCRVPLKVVLMSSNMPSKLPVTGRSSFPFDSASKAACTSLNPLWDTAPISLTPCDKRNMKPLRPSVSMRFVKSPWLTASAAVPTSSIRVVSAARVPLKVVLMSLNMPSKSPVTGRSNLPLDKASRAACTSLKPRCDTAPMPLTPCDNRSMKPLRPSVSMRFVKSPWLTASAAVPTSSMRSFNSCNVPLKVVLMSSNMPSKSPVTGRSSLPSDSASRAACTSLKPLWDTTLISLTPWERRSIKPLWPSVLMRFVKSPWLTASAASPTSLIRPLSSCRVPLKTDFISLNMPSNSPVTGRSRLPLARAIKAV